MGTLLRGLNESRDYVIAMCGNSPANFTAADFCTLLDMVGGLRGPKPGPASS